MKDAKWTKTNYSNELDYRNMEEQKECNAQSKTENYTCLIIL